jgi:hypothetical protein
MYFLKSEYGIQAYGQMTSKLSLQHIAKEDFRRPIIIEERDEIFQNFRKIKDILSNFQIRHHISGFQIGVGHRPFADKNPKWPRKI